MATISFIKDNIVIDCLLFDNEQNPLIEEIKQNLNADIAVCSDSTEFKGVHCVYIDGVFYSPKPYDSWIWDNEKNCWDAPVSKPDEESDWKWLEDKLQWEKRNY